MDLLSALRVWRIQKFKLRVWRIQKVKAHGCAGMERHFVSFRVWWSLEVKLHCATWTFGRAGPSTWTLCRLRKGRPITHLGLLLSVGPMRRSLPNLHAWRGKKRKKKNGTTVCCFLFLSPTVPAVACQEEGDFEGGGVENVAKCVRARFSTLASDSSTSFPEVVIVQPSQTGWGWAHEHGLQGLSPCSHCWD